MFIRPRSLFLMTTLIICLCGSVLQAEEKIAIRMVPEAAPGAVIEITGLSPEQQTILQKGTPTPEQQLILEVFVGEELRQRDQPTLLGELQTKEGKVQFQPRFPFQAGLTYRAVLTLSTTDDTGLVQVQKIESLFPIPEKTNLKRTELQHIYPTTEKLPENLLRLYLEFSAPMSQGHSYDYLHLLDEAGNEIELPFLELQQELWNSEGTRLTILFDPGRVKRGLKPREDEGPVFVAGNRYTFVVDAGWPDANGHPLKQGARKPILSTKADYTQPNPELWKVTTPAAGTQDPLVIAFPEPLDHGMLHRVLQVLDPERNPVPGKIRISQNETQWAFVPEQPWQSGEYGVEAETILEDAAGNSIGRPFERDLTKPAPEIPKTVTRPFTISP